MPLQVMVFQRKRPALLGALRSSPLARALATWGCGCLRASQSERWHDPSTRRPWSGAWNEFVPSPFRSDLFFAFVRADTFSFVFCLFTITDWSDAIDAVYTDIGLLSLFLVFKCWAYVPYTFLCVRSPWPQSEGHWLLEAAADQLGALEHCEHWLCLHYYFFL